MIFQVYFRSCPLDLHVIGFNVQCALKPFAVNLLGYK